jgi:hypothetical protein
VTSTQFLPNQMENEMGMVMMQAHTIIGASDAVGSWAWLSASLLPSPASPESKDVSPTIIAKARPSIVAVNFVPFIAIESWCQRASLSPRRMVVA